MLFNVVHKELAPGEDRGAFFISVEAPEGAGYDYTVAQIKKVEELLAPLTGDDKPVQRVNTRVPGFFGACEDMNTGQAIIFLQDWDKRRRDHGGDRRLAAQRARRDTERAGDAVRAHRAVAQQQPPAADRARRPRIQGNRAVARP